MPFSQHGPKHGNGVVPKPAAPGPALHHFDGNRFGLGYVAVLPLAHLGSQRPVIEIALPNALLLQYSMTLKLHAFFAYSCSEPFHRDSDYIAVGPQKRQGAVDFVDPHHLGRKHRTITEFDTGGGGHA